MRILLLIGCLSITACDVPNKPASEAKQEKKYTREELKALLVGKAPKEVIELIGKPEETSGDGDNSLWIYRNITTDTATGKVDRRTSVFFYYGAVHNVSGTN